ncbi:GAF domain-containing protein [Streptomyces anthocyanicus]|uniref:GAF domain-containing protein n=1 Tax=Streptomyces anthocyanicus TaxID=68174 RepID=UPI0037F8CCC6
MPTFDLATGLHERVPPDTDRDRRLALLESKGLLADRPVEEFDAVAKQAALEAGELVETPDGFLAMVNIMKDHQYFAGLWIPPETSTGASQASTDEPVRDERVMARTVGWCVQTVDRRKALPLDNVYDYPRWIGKAVHQLGFETYLGVPLIDPATDIALGTMCLVGRAPVRWTPQAVGRLKDHAAHVMQVINDPSALTLPAEH